jgi:O-antigen ligase
MPDKAGFHTSLFYTFYVALILGFISLWISPFLVSLSTTVLAVTVILSFKNIWNEHKGQVLVLAAFVLIAALDLLRGGDQNTVSAKLMLMVGFLFLQLAGVYYFKNRRKELILFLLISACAVALVNVHAVLNYALFKDLYDKLLLQSKAIPILNMHHIHFGIINALIIFSLLGILVKQLVHNRLKTLTIVLLLILLVCFHILSSRTGIIAFYGGLVITVLIYAIDKKEYKKMMVVLSLFGLLITASYYLVQPFQNKVYNSLEDIESWRDGGDINYKSMGMRFEAYRMCNAIILEHPIIGVGSGNQNQEMQRTYVKKNTVLEPVNRIGPHNQFLEYGVKYGLIGMMLLVVYFLMFVKEITPVSYIFVGMLAVLFIALQFESLLERQSSIYFTVVFTSIGYNLFRK